MKKLILGLLIAIGLLGAGVTLAIWGGDDRQPPFRNESESKEGPVEREQQAAIPLSREQSQVDVAQRAEVTDATLPPAMGDDDRAPAEGVARSRDSGVAAASTDARESLEERRRRLDNRTPEFQFFTDSMTRLTKDLDSALDAWEISVELSELVAKSKESKTPLPSEGVVLDLIKERVGVDAFDAMRAVFVNGPTNDEPEFTRYLYKYRRAEKSGNPKPLVIRGVNKLAIWFLSRDTGRQWGYL